MKGYFDKWIKEEITVDGSQTERTMKRTFLRSLCGMSAARAFVSLSVRRPYSTAFSPASARSGKIAASVLIHSS